MSISLRPSLGLAAILVASILFPAVARAGDPTNADCLAAADASLKEGNEHHLRAERGALLVCSHAACPVDIRKECNQRLDELAAEVPTIVFEVKDPAGRDLSAVKVSMDTEVLAERLQGTALSIDPGEHVFTFEAAGYPTTRKTFLIRQAQKDRREVVIIGEGGPAKAETPAGEVSKASPVDTRSSGMGTQKILALGAGGVGVVGLVLGAAFGAVALSDKSAAQNLCANECPTQAGVDKWHSTVAAGNVSTVGFIVGLAGLGGAAALWFTAPSGATQVGFGPGTVQVAGTF